ncbi:glycosyltransferase family 39 protein [Candidatus Woesearchaeota archaeon]|nr:glycosyltransferase family 39 protein [Candidatus Woesearchaeota archaeon]
MLQIRSTKRLLGKYTHNTGFLLILILLFALVLRLIFFSGMGTSDDLAYSRYAANIGKGIEPESVLTLSTRLGIIYTTAFSYKLFGINDFSSVLFVFLTSLASIILIFYFGKLLFNEKIGLMAAFLLSFFPLDVFYSTKLFTDLPSAFFMALGVYVFLYSEMKSRLKYGIGYMLSGIFIGIGYLIRESVLLIVLFFIIYILYKKRVKKEYFLVPLGVLIIIVFESLLFLNVTGDPLFRFNASQKYLEDAVIQHNYFGRLDFPTGLFHYPWLFLTNNLLSFFYIFVFIAIGYAIIYRKKESYVMLLWLLPLMIYLAFGSSSLTQYIPFKAADRYTYLFTMPAILLLAFFLMDKNELMKKVIMPLTLMLLLISSIGAVYLAENVVISDNLKKLYSELKSLGKTIYLDDRSVKAIDYLSGYKNSLDLRKYPNNFSGVKDAYVVINSDMIRRYKDVNRFMQFPDEIENPSKSWKVIKQIGKCQEAVTIYYVK